MNERPTPETDAETMRDEYDHVDSDIGPFAPSNTVCADFARKLERERDEAREELCHLRACVFSLISGARNGKNQQAIAVNKEAFEELKRAWNENAVHIFFNGSEEAK